MLEKLPTVGTSKRSKRGAATGAAAGGADSRAGTAPASSPPSSMKSTKDTDAVFGTAVKRSAGGVERDREGEKGGGIGGGTGGVGGGTLKKPKVGSSLSKTHPSPPASGGEKDVLALLTDQVSHPTTPRYW